MPFGVSLKFSRTSDDEHLFRHLARAVRVDQHRDRLGDADGVGELHGAAIGQIGRDDVLRDVARHVARRAVDLRRILARERAAAVRGRAAVGVDDDLAAGEAGVAVRAADHEAAGRVDQDARLRVHQRRRDDLLDDVLGDVGAELLGRDLVAVLRRDDHGVDADRRVAVVLDADLGLAVRPEVGRAALAARLRQPLAQPVRQHDRQRHQLRRLAAGVAEHQALVAGAAGVHAHRDVGRLAVDRGDDAAGVAVEPVLGVGVADFPDGLADQLLHVDVGVGRDLAGDEAEAGRDERLARHAAGRILREDRIQDAVRNLIGDLVRMSFRHRLGREQVAAFTTHVSPCGSRCACQNRSILPDPPGRSTTDDVIRAAAGVLR